LPNRQLFLRNRLAQHCIRRGRTAAACGPMIETCSVHIFKAESTTTRGPSRATCSEELANAAADDHGPPRAAGASRDRFACASQFACALHGAASAFTNRLSSGSAQSGRIHGQSRLSRRTSIHVVDEKRFSRTIDDPSVDPSDAMEHPQDWSTTAKRSPPMLAVLRLADRSAAARFASVLQNLVAAGRPRVVVDPL